MRIPGSNIASDLALFIDRAYVDYSKLPKTSISRDQEIAKARIPTEAGNFVLGFYIHSGYLTARSFLEEAQQLHTVGKEHLYEIVHSSNSRIQISENEQDIEKVKLRAKIKVAMVRAAEASIKGELEDYSEIREVIKEIAMKRNIAITTEPDTIPFNFRKTVKVRDIIEGLDEVQKLLAKVGSNEDTLLLLGPTSLSLYSNIQAA